MTHPSQPSPRPIDATPLVAHDRLTRIEARLDRIEHLLSKLIALWEAPPPEPAPASVPEHVDPHLGAL